MKSMKQQVKQVERSEEYETAGNQVERGEEYETAGNQVER